MKMKMWSCGGPTCVVENGPLALLLALLPSPPFLSLGGPRRASAGAFRGLFALVLGAFAGLVLVVAAAAWRLEGVDEHELMPASRPAAVLVGVCAASLPPLGM